MIAKKPLLINNMIVMPTAIQNNIKPIIRFMTKSFLVPALVVYRLM